MPTPGQALLAAIRDNPENPAPRLALADWLEESAPRQAGEKRDAALAHAEVVRWYAGLPPGREAGEHEGHRHIWRLQSQHHETWRRLVPRFARKWVRFDRGLPTYLDLSTAEFLEHGERLRVELPFISLQLDKAGGLIDEVVNSGLLRGIREFKIFSSDLQDAELIRLCRSSDLVNVRSLVLYVRNVGEEAAVALATSGPLAGLTNLTASCGPHIGPALADRRCTLRNLTELSCGGLESAGAVALADSPVVDGLTELSLSFSKLDENATAALAASPRLARLRRLDVGNGHIGDGGLAALAASPHLRGLEHLRVVRNGITAVGTKALGRSTLAASLKVLRIGSNALGDEAAVALFEGSTFRRLEELHLGDGSRDGSNNISGPGIAALVRSHIPATLRKLGLYFHDQLGPEGAKELACSAFPRLEEIDLTHCKIGPEGAIALSRSPAFTALRRIDLQDNDLDSAAVAAIARASWIATLDRLTLSNNAKVDSEGAKALADCPALGGLEWVDVGDCGIGPEGGLALARSPHFQKLSSMILAGNKLGPEAGKAIVTAPWLPTVTYLALCGCGIGPEAGEALLASPHLDHIEYLVLSDNGIAGDLRKQFKKRLGTRVEF